VKFDPIQAATRIDRFWKLGSEFGSERSAYGIYLDEIVSDRYVLVNGLRSSGTSCSSPAPTRTATCRRAAPICRGPAW